MKYDNSLGQRKGSNQDNGERREIEREKKWAKEREGKKEIA